MTTGRHVSRGGVEWGNPPPLKKLLDTGLTTGATPHPKKNDSVLSEQKLLSMHHFQIEGLKLGMSNC